MSMDQLAATKAVAFAEDARFGATIDYALGVIDFQEYIEVIQACAYVRGVAAAGTASLESA